MGATGDRRRLREWVTVAVAARTADEALSAGVVLAVLPVHGQTGAAAVAATLTGSTALAGPLVGVVLDRSASLSVLVRREVVGMCLVAAAMGALVVGLAVTAPVAALLPLVAVVGAGAPVVGAGWSVVAVAMTSRSSSVADAAAYNVAGVGGPAAGGLLLSLGPGGLLVLAPVVLVAAALAARLRCALPPAGRSWRGSERGATGQLVDGVRLLLREAPLRRTTTVSTIGYAGMGLTMVGLPVHAAQQGGGAAGGGMLLSAVAVGALVGTSLMTLPALQHAAERAVLVGTAGVGAGLLVLSTTHGLGVSAVLAALVGVADGLLFTGTLRVRERDLPAAGRTSAYAGAATLKIAAFAAGAASAGALAPEGGTLLLTAAAVQGAALSAGLVQAEAVTRRVGVLSRRRVARARSRRRR